MPISVAIIGSGPAGFYTADALLKCGEACKIDIIERLPTPYGLIRGGVAPDHQTTKRVALKYEKTALVKEVNYYGNVEINKDVGLDELRQIYDAVVLAVGAPEDRKLEIPGADKYGVFGSAAFVGWYNGHPDFRDLDPDLNISNAVVIGNGNVAIDCARVLLRTPRGMSASDLPDHVGDLIHAAPITDVYLVGRRGPEDAKFTNVELREIGKLRETVPQMKSDQMPNSIEETVVNLKGRDRRLAERNLNTLEEFSERSADEKRKRIHFEFYSKPIEILGGDRVEGVRFERTEVNEGHVIGTGEIFEIDCGLVIAAIGYQAVSIKGAPYDEKQAVTSNVEGRVGNGLYAVGWTKRGPTGVISSNRSDGEIVAQHIKNDLAGGGRKPGRKAFEVALKARGIRSVSFNDWKRIDEMERAAADGAAPRRKFVTVEEMLDALDGEGNSEVI